MDMGFLDGLRHGINGTFCCACPKIPKPTGQAHPAGWGRHPHHSAERKEVPRRHAGSFGTASARRQIGALAAEEIRKTRSGKPSETVGRKATGLRPRGKPRRYVSRAAK